MHVRRLSVLVAALAVLAFVISGCGGGEQPATTAPESEGMTEQEPGEATSMGATGDLMVTARFEGEAPARKEYDASGNPECNTDTIQGEAVVVNDNGTLRNVVIAVQEGPAGLEASGDGSATIDQTGCRYVPHVVVLQPSGTLTVKDSDDGLHNVRATTPEGQQLFNKTTFQGQSVDVEASSFGGPGVYQLECNVHPWMQAWVYVSGSGRAAVTGETGEVTLSDLPAGEYTVEAWHEKYGAQTQTVTVEGDGEASLGFTFTPGS